MCIRDSFHGEVMLVRMGAADFGSKGCDLLWCMNERSSQREVARGKTGILFFDYATRKVTQVPEKFRARLEPVSYTHLDVYKRQGE